MSVGYSSPDPAPTAANAGRPASAQDDSAVTTFDATDSDFDVEVLPLWRRILTSRYAREAAMRVAAVAAFLGVWQWYASSHHSLFLPSPSAIWDSLVKLYKTPDFVQRQVLVTLQEIVVGFACGVAVGVIIGILITRSKTAAAVLQPFVLAAQMVPKIALAPLFVVWFGYGTTPRLLTVVLVTFFPLLVNTILGIHSTDADARDLFKVIHASRWTVFRKLELPGALPVIFSALKVSIVLAVVSATVAEFIGSTRGLGSLIIGAMSTYDVPQMFAVLGIITVLGLVLYGILSLLERRVLHWHESVWLRGGHR